MAFSFQKPMEESILQFTGQFCQWKTYSMSSGTDYAEEELKNIKKGPALLWQLHISQQRNVSQSVRVPVLSPLCHSLTAHYRTVIQPIINWRQEAECTLCSLQAPHLRLHGSQPFMGSMLCGTPLKPHSAVPSRKHFPKPKMMSTIPFCSTILCCSYLSFLSSCITIYKLTCLSSHSLTS